MDKRKPLHVIRPSSQGVSPELWTRFVARAQALGMAPSRALAIAIRRFLGDPDDAIHPDAVPSEDH
jgi:hypothetical protein